MKYNEENKCINEIIQSNKIREAMRKRSKEISLELTNENIRLAGMGLEAYKKVYDTLNEREVK